VNSYLFTDISIQRLIEEEYAMVRRRILKLLDQRKQAKLQWLQDPSEINDDNLNNVRREASRYSRNKKREYLKDKINERATNSKNKNIRDLFRGINEFKTGYQSRNNLVKDENSDLLADSHKLFDWWKGNHLSQLLNVHNVSDVGQIEVHTAEPLVPGPSRLGIEIAIAKLKKNNRQVVIKFRQN
jgi:hypothetical protein